MSVSLSSNVYADKGGLFGKDIMSVSLSSPMYNWLGLVDNYGQIEAKSKGSRMRFLDTSYTAVSQSCVDDTTAAKL